MWRITAVMACACTALALAGGASSTTFGVADDAGKYADDGGPGFFHMLTDLGMTWTRMAGCCDAVNAGGPNITVIGFGPSPRGHGGVEASSHVARSPLRFLGEVGEAYRASGRTKPIGDEVSIHCYPNLNTDAPTVGYAW